MTLALALQLRLTPSEIRKIVEDIYNNKAVKWQKNLDNIMFSGFDTIMACYRRTDGRTADVGIKGQNCYNNTAACIASEGYA